MKDTWHILVRAATLAVKEHSKLDAKAHLGRGNFRNQNTFNLHYMQHGHLQSTNSCIQALIFGTLKRLQILCRQYGQPPSTNSCMQAPLTSAFK